MHKKILALFLCLTMFATLAPTAHAAGKLVTQKTSTATGGVYVSVQLHAGHLYRVQIGSPKHNTFSGMGGEEYTYVSKQHLFNSNKSFQIKGTTPKAFTVRQTIKGNVTGWILYMDVSLARGKTVTVRIFDMGKA